VYQPCIDEITHEILGWCDPASVSYRDDVHRDLGWILEEAYGLVDRQLANLLAALPRETSVVVSSDHGMAGLSHVAYVNRVLEKAGLLHYHAGAIDLSRTRAVYHPAGNGSLWVNRDGYVEGHVSPRDVHDVLVRARRALESVRHPTTGGAALQVQATPDPAAEGDLLVVPSRGVHLTPKVSPTGGSIEATHKSASHLIYSGDPSLDAFYAGRGRALGKAASRLDSREVLPRVLETLPETSHGRLA